MVNIKTLKKNIRRRNILITSLIVILLSISFLSLVTLFKQQEKGGEIINLAGSQRMLSQRIAYFAYLYLNGLSHGEVDKGIKKSLFEAANTFSENQKLLTQLAINEKGLIPEDVSFLYLTPPESLNHKINIYVDSARALSQIKDINRAQELINTDFEKHSIEQLLVVLDLVVSKIELHVNERITYSEMIKSILWLATIVLLIMIAFWVFIPLQRTIKKNYHDISITRKQSTELNFAINKHAIVFRITIDEKVAITEVNKRFLEFYCYEESEVLGLSVVNICGENYSLEYFDNIVKECAENEYWHGEIISRIKGGRELWLDSTIVPFKNSKNEIESYIIIQNDISGIKQTELVLNQLHDITSNIDITAAEKIQNILKLGKHIFNLPLALISEINNEEYRVLYCDTLNNEVSSGDVFELGNTYCFHTLNTGKAIAFHHASRSEIKEHPCYESFALESYVGVPLIVDGKKFGTLNFSGPEPSPRKFTLRELDLVQLFSHWIGSELTRTNFENKLLAQQSLMEQVEEQARIGIWEVDMINHSIYWSEVTQEIHEVPSHYQPDLTAAINFYKKGNNRNTLEMLFNSCISDGAPFYKDLQLITAKGNEVWVSVRGRAEFENGNCIRVFGSFQDITDKVLAQYEITAQNQRMKLAADSAGIGIWEYDLISNEVKWDEWMYELYGFSQDNVNGAYALWEMSLHPDDKEDTVEKLLSAIENNAKFDAQYRIIRPDNSIKYIKASAAVIFDHSQNATTVIGVNYDVTDQIENEIALTKAKIQAEIAVTAKNEFFASMSHEIRTPMNGVLGMLDLLQDSKLNQEQEHRISIAQQSATSLLSLINDVLDFSKIDANKLELENISFNFIRMLGDLSEAFAQQAQNKKLELILDTIEVEESLVKGDSNRIRQILTNLLANAIKFTKQGEVILRARQQHHSKTHWRIIVEVCDTGIGIPEAKQAALFEAFSQVDASTTREYGGTGLGLAIVKKLCLCMQGSIKVESKEGGGSVFICELLLEKSSDSLSSRPEKSLQNKRVLIIDSNKSCGEIIQQQLNCWNIDAEFITSGHAALPLLTSKAGKPQFDLIIMNRYMADEDELLFVQNVRNNLGLRLLKIMFVTLMTNQDDLSDCAQIGINGHFPKPITTADLHRSLDLIMDIPSTEQEEMPILDTLVSNDNDMPWMKNVRLLLVEDNRVNQMVAKGVLKKIGIDNIVIAINGLDAIDKLKLSDKGQPFNFIFMDCQMPEMDGYQATKLIREGAAGSRYQKVPIVAMTANAMLGDEQKCLDTGMDDYLVKPINRDQVFDTLQTFMSNKE